MGGLFIQLGSLLEDSEEQPLSLSEQINVCKNEL